MTTMVIMITRSNIYSYPSLITPPLVSEPLGNDNDGDNDDP